MTAASYETSEGLGSFRLVATGAWTLETGLAALDGDLRQFGTRSLDHELDIDLSGVSELDTAGAMMLQRVMRACGGRLNEDDVLRGFSGLGPHHSTLLEQAAAHMAPCDVEPPRPRI